MRKLLYGIVFLTTAMFSINVHAQTSIGKCAVSQFGDNVYFFDCDEESFERGKNFAKALSIFLKKNPVKVVSIASFGRHTVSTYILVVEKNSQTSSMHQKSNSRQLK